MKEAAFICVMHAFEVSDVAGTGDHATKVVPDRGHLAVAEGAWDQEIEIGMQDDLMCVI